MLKIRKREKKVPMPEGRLEEPEQESVGRKRKDIQNAYGFGRTGGRTQIIHPAE